MQKETFWWGACCSFYNAEHRYVYSLRTKSTRIRKMRAHIFRIVYSKNTCKRTYLTYTMLTVQRCCFSSKSFNSPPLYLVFDSESLSDDMVFFTLEMKMWFFLVATYIDEKRNVFSFVFGLYLVFEKFLRSGVLYIIVLVTSSLIYIYTYRHHRHHHCLWVFFHRIFPSSMEMKYSGTYRL